MKKLLQGFKRLLAFHLWRNFISGILVSAPLFLTVYMTWSVITGVDKAVKDLIPGRAWWEVYIPYDIPGIGLVLAFIVFSIIGATAAGFFGRYLVSMGEEILKRMPIVRSIYNATKQVMEAVFKRDKTSFQGVVLFQYPRPGIWTLGLVTGDTQGEIASKTPDKLLNIFVPTTPNPTSGFLLFVPEKDVQRLSMTAEEGIKMIVSTGLITPKFEE